MADKVFEGRIEAPRKTHAVWTSQNPVLLYGERVTVILEDGSIRHKTGDGVAAYIGLPFDEEEIVAAASAALTTAQTYTNDVVSAALNVAKEYSNTVAIHSVMSATVKAAGSSTSGSYLATKWAVANVDGITVPTNGMTIALRVPAAGVSGGILLSIDNGTTYYPIVRQVNSLVTTHYGKGATIVLTFNSTQTASPYTTSGKTATVTGCWQLADYDSDTKTRSSNNAGKKMYLIGATTQSTSGQTTYSNSQCYIGTDNCLYSNGKKVATADEIPDTLKNPNALTINGKVYDGSEAVNIEISGGSTSEVNALGQTPITLTEAANVKLIAEGECSYVAKSPTVADLSTATVANTLAKLTQYEDYVELESTGGANYYNSFVRLTFEGLIVNASYTLVVNALAPSLANKLGSGQFTIRPESGSGQIAALSASTAGMNTIDFIATTSTIVVDCYVASYYFNNDCKVVRFTDLYINEASGGTTRNGVFNKSGTFTNSYILGEVPKGITITSDPSCEVYGAEVIGDKTTGGATSPLTGKTIVCFGDSMFGMHRGDTSAPAYIAKRTGAIAHNMGFGGCRMSVHPTNGYAAFSMWALAKAIVENDWTTQDAQASSGSSYFSEHLATLKGIDFNSVDAVVIHYGANDFTGAVTIDDASNLTDYNTFCGAFRYSIERLLTAYPHLRIFVSVPAFRIWKATDGTVSSTTDTYTNSIGKKMIDYIDALKNAAKEYNLPVIDSYYGLGINKINVLNFLADEAHHNVDGRKRFGGYIGSRIIAEF